MSAAVPMDRLRPEAPVLWRAALVVVAAAVVVAGLSAWIRTPLSIAASFAVLQFLLRRAGTRGRVPALAALVGGGVVVLVLLGPVLNFTPWGLTSGSWGVGVGVVELVALLVARRRPDEAPVPARRVPFAPIAWGVAVAAVLAGAVGFSVASFNGTHVAPLALGLRVDGASRVVDVTAGSTEGPYDVDLVTADGRRVLAHDVTVGPGRTAVVRVPAGVQDRALVQLVPVGTLSPVRTLILAGGSGS